MPFIESAKYLGINYLYDVYCWIENDSIPEEVQNKLENFIKMISQ